MIEKVKSKFEQLKEGSRYLRGAIDKELKSEAPNFTPDAVQLLKFHGTYQQDDRDVRNERRKRGEIPLYSMMIRNKLPGGKLTAEQYLAHDDLADRYGNKTLRFTTRQDIQLHCVLKENLKKAIRRINETLVTTSGACGDIVRNVMACPAPSSDHLKLEVLQYTKAVSDQFLSRSRAYHEIWINGEKVDTSTGSDEAESEPIYGRAYLPRKFKIALAFPEDNCVDVYTNDIGIVPEAKGGRLAGFNILVGGGLGMSHGSKETFPRLADPFCFVAPDQLLDITKAIVLVQRDHGGRTSRKHARMKYLIADNGLNWFHDQVEKRYGKKLAPVHEIAWKGFEDHLGWHEQGGGCWYYGISVENGRVGDRDSLKLKSGLRAIVERFKTNVYLTPAQDILISDLKTADRKEFEGLLKEYKIPFPEQLSAIQRNSMACPALPTCGLAITESERVLPSIVDELERSLGALALDREKITLRMTGCPNGCVRPYSAEIGLVGRTAGGYNIYLGGNLDGTRLNEEFAANVPGAEIVKTLVPVFRFFKEKRERGEAFGNFCHRMGLEKLRQYRPELS